MLKINKINLIFIFIFTYACSQIPKAEKKPNWKYPPTNPFPSILKTRHYGDGNIALSTELKSINMSCRLRNDSPYYWCDLEGELINPDSTLPTKISSTFHVVVGEKGKIATLSLLKRLKKTNKPITIILEKSAFITSVDNSIYSQLLGLYTADECFDLLYDFSLCPTNAKKLEIFTGNYID